MPDRLQEVVEHEVRGWNDIPLAIRGVMREVWSL